jgi:cyclin-dependent kinase 8/11
VWAAGCIFCELLLGRAIFPGTDVKKKQAVQADQLKKIFKVLGKPTLSKWPDMEHLMYYKEIASWHDSDFQFCLSQLLKVNALLSFSSCCLL